MVIIKTGFNFEKLIQFRQKKKIKLGRNVFGKYLSGGYFDSKFNLNGLVCRQII